MNVFAVPYPFHDAEQAAGFLFPKRADSPLLGNILSLGDMHALLLDDAQSPALYQHDEIRVEPITHLGKPG